MGEIELGRLVDVEPRVAWQREDTHFTPWLAKNLDRLSDALGIVLELVGQEQGVGRFSADVLALNSETGTKVLVENQLESSDHRHLGQILTYLAGLEAETVVWIARHFWEEHLSAIRWLNQHTDERFSFFAVQLRVVQIGSSQLAPLFDVLEKPNKWERSLQQSANDAVNSASGWRRAFWDRYVEKFPNAKVDRGGGGYGSSRWRNILGSDLVVARWISEKAVGVFIRGGRGVPNEQTYERLQNASQRLEGLLGVPLRSDQWYPFMLRREFDLEDPAESDKAITWLEEQTQKYVSVISEHLEETA